MGDAERHIELGEQVLDLLRQRLADLEANPPERYYTAEELRDIGPLRNYLEMHAEHEAKLAKWGFQPTDKARVRAADVYCQMIARDLAAQGKFVLSVEEAAAMAGVGTRSLWDRIHDGSFPSRRLGRRVVVPVPLFLRWLSGEENQ